MIRPATLADIPAIIDLGRKFHALSPYSYLPFEPEKVAEALEGILSIGCVVVCDQDGVKGAAAAIKGAVWFTADQTSAQELFWYAEDCGRESHGLRLALEDWARSEGCSGFSMVCLENPKAPVLARLYRQNGYRPTEHHFMKVL